MFLYFGFCLAIAFLHPKPFHFAPPFLQNLNDGLDDFIPAGSTTILKDAIRLTPQERNKEGFLWARRTNELSEFEITFTINVTGPSYRGGDGIAFYYTKEPHKSGTIQTHPPAFNGFGLIFDSAGGHRKGPYSIRLVKNSVNNVLGGCTSEYRNSHLPFFVRILYYNKTIKIALSNPVKGGRKIYDKDVDSVDMFECFSTERIHTPIELPINYYFGFHASTSVFQDMHQILNLDITAPIHIRTLETGRPNRVIPASIIRGQPSASPPPAAPSTPVDPALAALQTATTQAEQRLSAAQQKVSAAALALQQWLDTAQASSTPQNPDAMTAPVTADELRAEFARIKEDIVKMNTGLDGFVQKVKDDADRLGMTVGQLTAVFEQNLNAVQQSKTDIEAQLKQSADDNEVLKNRLREALINSSTTMAASVSFSWGFWGVVIVVQIVFFLSIYYYWKKKDESSKKLL